MDNKAILIANIEYLGTLYRDEYLAAHGPHLENNWWASLKFFFNHSFMRGRRDQLSEAYCQFTIVALAELFQIDPGNPKQGYRRIRKRAGEFNNTLILEFKQRHRSSTGSSIKHPNFTEEVATHNDVVRSLTTQRPIAIEFPGEKTRTKSVRLANDEDLRMVLDVLWLISSPERQNIYCHLKNLIARDGPEAAYKELIELRAVGDKIATFIIRDIGILNPGLVSRDYRFAFPVDTWVRQLAMKLGIDGADDEAIKSLLIEECCRYKADPLLFAAGLWYMGFNAVDILIDRCLNSVRLPMMT